MAEPIFRTPRDAGPEDPTPPPKNPRYEFWGYVSGRGWDAPTQSDDGVLTISVHPISWHSILLRCVEDESAKLSFKIWVKSKGIVGAAGPKLDWKTPDLDDMSKAIHIKGICIELVGPHSRHFRLTYSGTEAKFGKENNWYRRALPLTREGDWCEASPVDNFWLSELKFNLQRR